MIIEPFPSAIIEWPLPMVFCCNINGISCFYTDLQKVCSHTHLVNREHWRDSQANVIDSPVTSLYKGYSFSFSCGNFTNILRGLAHPDLKKKTLAIWIALIYIDKNSKGASAAALNDDECKTWPRFLIWCLKLRMCSSDMAEGTTSSLARWKRRTDSAVSDPFNCTFTILSVAVSTWNALMHQSALMSIRIS